MGLSEQGGTFGSLPRGPRNLITDVPGVRVGQVTLSRGDIQTGVTAILPAQGNLFREKVPGACHVINGFGKAAGLVQLQELGSIETPIILTNTFGVGTGINALVRWALAENPEIGRTTGTINPLVLECNDGKLNDIRGLHVTEEDVVAAISSAGEHFAEGAAGAGRGMCCYQLKGGIGSASRIVSLGGTDFTLGALLLTNFGELPDLRLEGYETGCGLHLTNRRPDKGSCIVVLGTDLPLSHRQLDRICRRAQSGLARTGAYVAGGSGEIVVAFSNATRLPHFPQGPILTASFLQEDALDLVFRAATDCVEEAVVSSLVHAETVVGINQRRRLSLTEALAQTGGEV